PLPRSAARLGAPSARVARRSDAGRALVRGSGAIHLGGAEVARGAVRQPQETGGSRTPPPALTRPLSQPPRPRDPARRAEIPRGMARLVAESASAETGKGERRWIADRGLQRWRRCHSVDARASAGRRGPSRSNGSTSVES